MQIQLQEWGKGLGLRIPKSWAAKAGLRAGALVKLSLSGGQLVVQPIHDNPFLLKQLLEGVTPDNLHGESDSGPPIGKEIW